MGITCELDRYSVVIGVPARNGKTKAAIHVFDLDDIAAHGGKTTAVQFPCDGHPSRDWHIHSLEATQVGPQCLQPRAFDQGARG
jgi:hypothetical protein